MFCNTVALAAIRMSDRLDGADHSAFFKKWLDTAKEKLVDRRTGLLVSSFTLDGRTRQGPRGSSIWMAAHCLQLIDEKFAADQYRRAKQALGGNVLGLGYSREWPASRKATQDVDSGPLVPGLEASPAASGLALVGARAFDDREFFRDLHRSLGLVAAPRERDGRLRYAAGNQVGDAVILYAAVLGPLWEEVRKKPKELGVDLGHGVKMELVLIPAGEFLMGSSAADTSAAGEEKPRHRVRIGKPFYLGKYEVTQEQWQAIMGRNPSYVDSLKHPVEHVSWEDCQRFLKKLNERFRRPHPNPLPTMLRTVPGEGEFQLPTEAQWEYACRAGSTTKYCFGDDEARLGDYAWYAANSGAERTRWARRSPAPSGFTTCTGTWRSGARIGAMRAIMPSRRQTIRRALRQARPAFAAAGAPTTPLRVAVRRIAATSCPGKPTSIWASASA